MGKRVQSQGPVSQPHPAVAIPSFSGQKFTQVPPWTPKEWNSAYFYLPKGKKCSSES